MNFYETFWNHKYLTSETGWDIGYASTPLKEYFDTLTNKSLEILIPGAGNAYEAEYLFKNGFTNITVVDISSVAIKNFAKRVPNFPSEKLIHADFFDITGNYDLVIEQTFFCAIDPTQRYDYVEKMHQIIRSDGYLVGLLFNIPLNTDKPPFGGDKDEYKELFKDKFTTIKMETAYNSIPERAGDELFFIMSSNKTMK